MLKPNANGGRKQAACFNQVITQLLGGMNDPTHKLKQSSPHLTFIYHNQHFNNKLTLLQYFLQLTTCTALIWLRSGARTRTSVIKSTMWSIQACTHVAFGYFLHCFSFETAHAWCKPLLSSWWISEVLLISLLFGCLLVTFPSSLHSHCTATDPTKLF